VQPTPIYETVTMCLLAFGLWQLRDRLKPGVVFALYLLGSGLERLLVEFIRRNKEVVVGLTTPQLESIALIVIGAVWIGLLVRRGGREALTAQGGAVRRPTGAVTVGP
jgi:phosphatidylglycerol:prolipoprotein diacylglycerol transferase